MIPNDNTMIKTPTMEFMRNKRLSVVATALSAEAMTSELAVSPKPVRPEKVAMRGSFSRAAFHAAMEGLKKDRRQEGEALRAELRGIHERMTAALGIVDRGRQGLAAKYRDKLQERIAELLGPKGAALDAGRLEQEVALFADKADIEEEIIRLRAHLSRLNDILSDESDEGKGRALEFLNQEILREVNTIGSKSRDLDIITQVLELKNLAESMKEQTANIE